MLSNDFIMIKNVKLIILSEQRIIIHYIFCTNYTS